MANARIGHMRPMVAADLAQVWQWRNHPEVRVCMLSSEEIPWEQHCAWFERAQADPARFLLVFERPEGAAGFVQYSLRQPEGGVADWSFHANPGLAVAARRGLGEAALDYGFAELGLHKVCGQVLASNERSLAFHRRLGFAEEGLLREQHWNGVRHVAIFCFGLLRHEYPWRSAESEQGFVTP